MLESCQARAIGVRGLREQPVVKTPVRYLRYLGTLVLSVLSVLSGRPGPRLYLSQRAPLPEASS